MTETKTKHLVSCFTHLIGMPCGCELLGKSEPVNKETKKEFYCACNNSTTEDHLATYGVCQECR